MSRISPWLLILVVWAAIYLPALGSFEIKGEEGRRILPAIAMIESGNYLVPKVGSDTYFRKPPLINWLVAASFKTFGVRNEWTARVPSILCVLAVAIAFITIGRAVLGGMGATIAALIWLTNVGMIEKGRLIEIEALYISLCALALIFWLSWWQQNRSPWLTWIVPWIFLGIGFLAKGPTFLLFFYAVVLAVLWQSKQWRALRHPAHFVGLALMLGIFASWAIPLSQMTEAAGPRMMRTWSNQFVGRVTGEYWKFSTWITTIPRELLYFLPWLLFLPLIRFNKFPEGNQRQVARGLMWGAIVPCIIINMIPGAAARYALPALTALCWFLGMAFAANAFALPNWLNTSSRPLWARVGPILVGLAIVAGVLGYPVASLVFKHRQKVKNIAAEINAAVPETETLYAVDPNYQPLFFYMRAPVKYVSSLEELPYDARYFLIRPDNEKNALASEQWSPRHARAILRKTDYRDQTMILLGIDG